MYVHHVLLRVYSGLGALLESSQPGRFDTNLHIALANGTSIGSTRALFLVEACLSACFWGHWPPRVFVFMHTSVSSGAVHPSDFNSMAHIGAHVRFRVGYGVYFEFAPTKCDISKHELGLRFLISWAYRFGPGKQMERRVLSGRHGGYCQNISLSSISKVAKRSLKAHM